MNLLMADSKRLGGVNVPDWVSLDNIFHSFSRWRPTSNWTGIFIPCPNIGNF